MSNSSAAADLLTAVRDALDAPPADLPGRVTLVRSYIETALDAPDRNGSWRMLADRLAQAAGSMS